MTLEVQPLFDAARVHWQRRADAAPSRTPEAAMLRPEEMAPWMPHALLVDFYGQEFTGLGLGALPFSLDEDNNATRRVWWRAGSCSVAAQGWANHAFAPDRTVVLDRLLLPYAGRIAGTRMLMVLQIPRPGAIDNWRITARRAAERSVERRAEARDALPYLAAR